MSFLKQTLFDEKMKIKRLKIEYFNRDIKNLFERKEENYYKPARVSNFWSKNYIECESSGDRRKNCLLKNVLIKLNHI